MVVSAAKLEANRRNAQKSTGPRTDEGKEKAKMNATKHGLRAETLIVLEEDPQVLEDRREAWRGCLLPGDDVEERLVDSAVVHTWMQDRARRAQAEPDQRQHHELWSRPGPDHRGRSRGAGPAALQGSTRAVSDVSYRVHEHWNPPMSERDHIVRGPARRPRCAYRPGAAPAIDAPGLRVAAGRMGQAQDDPRPGPALGRSRTNSRRSGSWASNLSMPSTIRTSR